MNKEQKDFKVVAVSSNTNSFGLHQFIAIAPDGELIKAHANHLNVPKVDDVVNKSGSFEMWTTEEFAPSSVVRRLWA